MPDLDSYPMNADFGSQLPLIAFKEKNWPSSDVSGLAFSVQGMETFVTRHSLQLQQLDWLI